MKINREARRDARKLFHICLVEGRIDEGRVRAVVQKLAHDRPRHFLAILTRFHKLVEIEVHKRTFFIESSVELADKGASLVEGLKQRFGAPLATHYAVNPALLGGVLLRVGSRIWDGSIRQRLRVLTSPSN